MQAGLASPRSLWAYWVPAASRGQAVAVLTAAPVLVPIESLAQLALKPRGVDHGCCCPQDQAAGLHAVLEGNGREGLMKSLVSSPSQSSSLWSLPYPGCEVSKNGLPWGVDCTHGQADFLAPERISPAASCAALLTEHRGSSEKSWVPASLQRERWDQQEPEALPLYQG